VPDPTKVAEYQGAVIACALARQILRAHDIPAILAAIEHAHAIGPILDPTAYREKGKAMEEDRELLTAAMKLRSVGGDHA
jgi:hypothetical protein